MIKIEVSPYTAGRIYEHRMYVHAELSDPNSRAVPTPFDEWLATVERDLVSTGEGSGRAAGSWAAPGDPITAQAILDGYDDGDPEVMDMCPSPLSGEWAGGSLTELGLENAPEELLSRYEEAYSDGFWAEVISSAQYQVAGDD